MRQEELLAVASGVLILVVLLGGAAAARFFRSGAKVQDEASQVQAEARPVGGGARRLAAGARRRRQAGRQAQDEEGEGAAEPEVQDQARLAGVSATRKDAYEERRRKKDEEREAQERAEELEAARKDAARQAAEDAEAAKWLGQISVEKEGDEATEDAEQQGLLIAFVDYIKDRKTVVLEDLAAHFGLRVQDVINRVQNLESVGTITGVMDDRGKFIYISKEEMQAVADFIQRKGRVSVSELAAKSNTFIDLEEKAAEGGLETLDLDLEDSQTADLNDN